MAILKSLNEAMEKNKEKFSWPGPVRGKIENQPPAASPPVAKGKIEEPPVKQRPQTAFTNKPELDGQPVEGNPGVFWQYRPGNAEEEITATAAGWKPTGPPGQKIEGSAFSAAIQPGQAGAVSEAIKGIKKTQEGVAKTAETEKAATSAKIPTREEFKQDYVNTYFGGTDPGKISYEEAWSEAEKTTIPQYFEDTFGVSYEDLDTLDKDNLKIWNTMRATYRKEVKDAIKEQQTAQSKELTDAMKQYDETVKSAQKPPESRTVLDEATGNKVIEEWDANTQSWKSTGAIAEKAKTEKAEKKEDQKVEGYTLKEATDYERKVIVEQQADPTKQISKYDLSTINKIREGFGKPALVETITGDKKDKVYTYNEEEIAQVGNEITDLTWQEVQTLSKQGITPRKDAKTGLWYDAKTGQVLVRQ